MNYLISDEIPSGWESIIDSFVTMAEWEVEFNKGRPIKDLTARVHKGLLQINYGGGSEITDAHARFAREHSSKVCYSCGSLSTRVVFQYPKCDECD